MQNYPMTEQGANLLKEELTKLKNKDRPSVINAIAEARAHGDLKENAEYKAAKEMQSMIEGKIAHLEEKLSHATIITPAQIANETNIVFGSYVTVFNSQQAKEFTYQLVGDDEADIRNNKISINSPLARSLIGKKVGDSVEVAAPKCSIEYEILEIKNGI